MLNGLPPLLVGAIASVLMVLNALFWVPILLVFSMVKLLLPFTAAQKALAPVLLWIAEAWISCNSAWMALTQRTQWDVQVFTGFATTGSGGGAGFVAGSGAGGGVSVTILSSSAAGCAATNGSEPLASW